MGSIGSRQVVPGPPLDVHRKVEKLPPAGQGSRELPEGRAEQRRAASGRAGQRGGGDKGPYLDSCMAREGGSVADNTNAAHHRSPFLLERSSSSLAMAATSFTAASVPSCSSSAVKVRNNFHYILHHSFNLCHILKNRPNWS